MMCSFPLLPSSDARGLVDILSILCQRTSYFFFSSERRHTRCALVTGVQTCALPILVRAKSIAFWRRARSSSDMGCSFIGGAFLGGVVAGEVFGADRAGDRVEMLHAVNEPGQFVGGDFIGMGIAGLDKIGRAHV